MAISWKLNVAMKSTEFLAELLKWPLGTPYLSAYQIRSEIDKIAKLSQRREVKVNCWERDYDILAFSAMSSSSEDDLPPERQRASRAARRCANSTARKPVTNPN